MIRNSRSRILFLGCIVQWLLVSNGVNGFAPTNGQSHSLERVAKGLYGGFLDDWKNFFNNNNNNSDDDEEEYAAGEINVVTIPVQDIKPGGLRLFLMFYLMGMQNTPSPKTWAANQPSTEDYVVDFWYHDNSAVLSVTLTDTKITINRVGSRPSTGYMIQESLVVQGLLDELETMANDPNVAKENRLLIPETERSIATARDALAFG
mmetsp:Transcript_12650/g.24322  ORF Transcript_12650/g.24322 Transcript_12650/m.24322 type:complete len:206 (+) Transcript_12650:203-820(+)